ncbi:PTS-dependent dihydroxyacetone kinase, ADP-binding subunit DhaL [compost metagenome]
MCDAWWPALAALQLAQQQALPLAEALDKAVVAAAAGAEATIQMQARKGRASYLGERSIGHQDAGATSTLLLLTALRDRARL